MPLPPALPLHIRPSVRRELMALVTKPTAPQRAVRRALVLLDAADGISNAEISRQRKIAREYVIAIRRRFEERGIESVYQDAPGRGRPKQMSEETAAKIVTTTMQSTPKNATHWTADEMARRFGVSSSTIYRLWRAHNLSSFQSEGEFGAGGSGKRKYGGVTPGLLRSTRYTNRETIIPQPPG